MAEKMIESILFQVKAQLVKVMKMMKIIMSMRMRWLNNMMEQLLNQLILSVSHNLMIKSYLTSMARIISITSTSME